MISVKRKGSEVAVAVARAPHRHGLIQINAADGDIQHKRSRRHPTT
jgi:hypothetical protein